MFPDLVGRKFAHHDMDDSAWRWTVENGVRECDPNPFLDPVACNRMVQEAHKRLDTEFSYGGYMEERALLWRGSYVEREKKPLHLGIDINVPEHTLVAVDWPCTVLLVDNIEEEHGWGTRVIVSLRKTGIILIYAHLEEAVVREGDELFSGETIGIVGRPEKNGGWFTHLHVQAVRERAFQAFLLAGLDTLDGYGPANEYKALGEMFPDPTPWIHIP